MTARASKAVREACTFTLSPHTVAKLDALSLSSGTSRGRLIDLALSCLDACDDCRGSGWVGNPDGGLTCKVCGGHGIVPTETYANRFPQ